MNAPGTLERLERVIDASAVAPRIEALLPIGVPEPVKLGETDWVRI